MAIDAVRGEVSALPAELVRHNLVAWTAGSVSGRVVGGEFGGEIPGSRSPAVLMQNHGVFTIGCTASTTGTRTSTANADSELEVLP
ncbi:MAG TPA: hypothetical protein VGJ53_10655 [Micromonosporaceae bacterium]|jgi:hypothetical protein